MVRWLHRLSLAVCVVFIGALMTTDFQPGRPAAGAEKAVAWPVYDLPKAVAAGAKPHLVSVAFTHRPTPTSDPLVWLYHPTSPPAGPPYYEIHFTKPPEWKDTAPFIVEGHAAFRSDAKRRISRVPGAVILNSASPR
jgi:hypothetical protein